MAFEKGSAWGRLGKGVTSPKKKKASAENGKLGGRPVYGAPYAVAYYCPRRKVKITVYFNKLESAVKVLEKQEGTFYVYSKIVSFFSFGRYKKGHPTLQEKEAVV